MSMSSSSSPSSTVEIASAFIHGAPPGELQDVLNDIQALTCHTDPSLTSKLKPAFQKYNEDQLATAELAAGEKVPISKYNRLGDGRYFDPESKTAFEFDHIRQKPSSPESYIHPSPHGDLAASLHKSLAAYATEHYPSPTYGVYPTSSSSADRSAEEEKEDSGLALLLVSNKYSPSNYWNGRWRSSYLLVPGTGTASLTGSIDVTVHYYEDGNVSLTTHKPVNVADLSLPASSTEAAAEMVLKKIAAVEKAYQIELNTAFAAMNEEGFKGLRRQLPVTRQKVEWEKVGGYRLGSDLKGEVGGVGGR